MPRPSRIAIDGPVGVGKSVVGHRLAEELGYRFLDTGAMYRAVTLLALRRGLAPPQEEALSTLARETRIRVGPASSNYGRQYSVFVGSEDVTWALRQPEVEAHVSQVSMIAGVREALVAQQREISQGGEIVMVGRDIGTVVLPQAELKIFLTASAQERARRRYQELLARGERVHYSEILADVERRDRIDSGRSLSPLRPAPDAHIVATDGLSLEEVLAQIGRLVGEE